MSKLSTSKYLGMLYVLIASVLFSIGGVCVKLVNWQPLSINSGRCIISALIIGIYLLITKHKLRFNRFVLLGTCAISGTNILFTYANKLTTAANVIVLQYTAPVFIILFTWIFLKQKPDLVDIVTTPFIFFGIICFFLDSIAGGAMLGNILALLSAVTYTGVFMLKVMPNSDSLSSVFFGMLFGALIGLPSLVTETDFGTESIVGIVLLGVFQLGIGYILFTEGLKSTPPLAASFIGFAEPLLNPCWAAVFLNETLGAFAILGATIVLVSICVYNICKFKSAKKRTQTGALIVKSENS